MTTTMQTSAELEAARRSSGQFGFRNRQYPGEVGLEVDTEPDFEQFTDDRGVTYISGNPCDPRSASAAANAVAQRIVADGGVAAMKSGPEGDHVEFEVRSFDDPFAAMTYAEVRGLTQSQVNEDNTMDLYDPDGGPNSIRLFIPQYS